MQKPCYEAAETLLRDTHEYWLLHHMKWVNGLERVRLYVWSISYLKKYKLLVALLVISCIISILCQMAMLNSVQYIVDEVLHDHRRFQFLILLNVGLLLVMILSLICKNLFERIIRERAGRDLLMDSMKHLRNLGYAYSESNPPGATLTILNNDIAALQNIYRLHFPSILTNATMLIVTAALSLSLNVSLTVLAFLCYLVYYLLGPFIDNKINKWGKIQSDNIHLFNKKLYESIRGQVELRSFNRESWDLERLLKTKQTLNVSTVKTAIYGNLRIVLRTGALFLGIGFIFYRVPYLYQEGLLSVGQFAVFMLFFFNLTNSVSNIINSINAQRLILFQADRVKQFFDTKPSVQESVDCFRISEPVSTIEFRNVSFAYSQSKPLLTGINLKIKAGEKVAIVGASGNGKSTMLKLLSRFYDPCEGEIYINGVPLNQISLEQIRELVGYMAQEPYLFTATVKENIDFGDPSIRGEECVQAARHANVHDFIIGLPHGYDSKISENGHNLSGGQKQRIAFARLLIKNPQIVLLDEATSALDNHNEALIQEALDKALNGRTIIAVVHRLSSLKNYDRIIVLDSGNIAETGTYEELISLGGLFYQLKDREVLEELEDERA